MLSLLNAQHLSVYAVSCTVHDVFVSLGVYKMFLFHLERTWYFCFTWSVHDVFVSFGAYMMFLFHLERTWCFCFQKRIVRTKSDIYGFFHTVHGWVQHTFVFASLVLMSSCSGSTACSFFDRKEYKTLSCICIISYKSPNKQNAKRKRVHCYLNRRLFFWSVDALFASERLLKRAKYALCHFLLSNITLIWRHADAYETLIPFHSSTLFTHIPFPLTYAFYAYPFPNHLRILRILLHNFFEHKYRRIKSLWCKSCTS